MPTIAIIERDVGTPTARSPSPPALLDAFPETDAWFICAGTDCPPSSRGASATAGPRSRRVREQEVELVVGNAFTFGASGEHDLP
ncbi:MAG: hypothetical protein HS111_23430 [Kofleriaceae bacterium]|nr:hypothetical protein [Kofleriaceae bacterium]